MWDSLFHLLADAPQAYVILFAFAALDGRLFHDKPWAAVLVAFGIAGAITLATEGWRRFRGGTVIR